MIKPGDRIPNVKLFESTGYSEDNHCPTSPQPVELEAACKGRKIVVFGIPGAFTPTCSGKHVPGFVAAREELGAKGVDEVICVSVNDGYVMAAFGRDQKVDGKVRMLGDGSGELTRALGLELDLSANGMGRRCKRFSMLVVDGVVKTVNVDDKGLDKTDARTMLAQVAQG